MALQSNNSHPNPNVQVFGRQGDNSASRSEENEEAIGEPFDQKVIEYSTEEHEDKTKFPSILTNSFLILFIGAIATLLVFFLGGLNSGAH